MPLESFISENAPLLFLLYVWSIPWKGMALWRAAKKRDMWWFIALLILNTAAILEILYIFFFSERKGHSKIDPHGTDKVL